MARFVLAHPDPAAPAVQAATLARARSATPGRPPRRRAGPHRPPGARTHRSTKKATCAQDIAVDDVRRSVSFFGSTAGEGGWRVAIVDAVDELNAAGANALLKVLEEPPTLRASAARQPCARPACSPTIRSRCRRLTSATACRGRCRRAPPPPPPGAAAGDPELKAAAAAAEGSVARALALARRLRARAPPAPARSARSPARVLDARALHGLGESLGDDDAPSPPSLDAVNGWLTARLATGRRSPAALARRGAGMGGGQPHRGRSRRIQSRPQADGVYRIRPPCRGGTRLIPSA